MIHEIHGDILQSRTVALVNPVNTCGVMGAGLALALRRAYPQMFESYKRACQRGTLRVGTVYTWPTGHSDRRYVICLPTKNDWRHPAQFGYVEKGLVALVAELERLHIPSVAIPTLGCGLGGLEWSAVRKLIVAAFCAKTITVKLYVPHVDIGASGKKA